MAATTPAGKPWLASTVCRIGDRAARANVRTGWPGNPQPFGAFFFFFAMNLSLERSAAAFLQRPLNRRRRAPRWSLRHGSLQPRDFRPQCPPLIQHVIARRRLDNRSDRSHAAARMEAHGSPQRHGRNEWRHNADREGLNRHGGDMIDGDHITHNGAIDDNLPLNADGSHIANLHASDHGASMKPGSRIADDLGDFKGGVFSRRSSRGGWSEGEQAEQKQSEVFHVILRGATLSTEASSRRERSGVNFNVCLRYLRIL